MSAPLPSSPRSSRPSRAPALFQPLAAVALAVAGLLSGSAQAQNLQTLYDAARDYDSAVLSARAQAESTLYKAEQSRALKRPSVNATGTSSGSRSETPWSSATTTQSVTNTIGISAQQSLFNRANEQTIAQAERGIEVARVQIGAAEQDLVVRITQAYFDVLSATDALATVQASKKAITEQLASAKRNFEVGTATITDTREAEARFDLARAQELAAQNDLDTARLALDQLVGRTNVQPNRLALPAALPPLLPADVEEWVRQAEENSPTLRQLRLALDVARLETEKARAAGSPTVGISGSMNLTHARVNGDTRLTNGNIISFGPNYGAGPSASVALQVQMPLYSGGSIEGRMKETVALEDKARTDLEAARRSVAQGTRTAYFGVRSLTARVQALEAAEGSSRLALEATQLGYKVGVRVNLDVLNAQTQLFTAQRDLAKARYDLIVNGLKLRQVSGVLQPSDLYAVNALLVP